MRGLTPSFKITYSEALQHTEEAINTEIKERDKKIQSLVEMIDDPEARIKDQNIVLDSNKN
jgi:flagellar capping protein FliD